MSNEIQTILNSPVVQQLNEKVVAVLGSDTMQGFQKAYVVADAIAALKELLKKPEYMKPIMALQGSRLGFKTDKDKTGGYSEEVVKECLIDAVLSGVQPTGNQFNIIAGNMYITKEGFGYLLGKMQGFEYTITFELPRIKDGSAAIVAVIEWQGKSKKMDIPIRVNSGMGTDAVIGKATRKARAWLYNSIAGTEFGDGDVTDIAAEVVGSKINAPEKSKEEIEAARILLMISDCKTLDELEKIRPHVGGADAAIADAFADKSNELSK